MRRAIVVAALSASGLTAGCGSNVEEFCYGCDQPGAHLPEGGEALLERVRLSPELTGTEDGATATWFYAVHFDAQSEGGELPPMRECTSLRDGTVYPTNALPNSRINVDFGDSIRLRSTDADVDETVPKTVPAEGAEGVRDNRANPDRLHSYVYGGPESDWQANLDPDIAQPDALYTVELGDGGQHFDFVFPPAYQPPVGVGFDAVTIPSGQDWYITWEAVPQVGDGEHTHGTHFAFVAFAEVTERGPEAIWLCPTDSDGSFTIPKEVIDDLPSAGLIQAGRLTHYMQELDDRRFDLMAIYCHISSFVVE